MQRMFCDAKTNFVQQYRRACQAPAALLSRLTPLRRLMKKGPTSGEQGRANRAGVSARGTSPGDRPVGEVLQTFKRGMGAKRDRAIGDDSRSRWARSPGYDEDPQCVEATLRNSCEGHHLPAAYRPVNDRALHAVFDDRRRPYHEHGLAARDRARTPFVLEPGQKRGL